MARKTQPGIPLISRFHGGESDTIREIPPEFRAALDLTVTEIPLPWDQDPPFLSDTVLASKAEMKVTSERMQRVTTKPPGTVTLLEAFTDRYKQLGTRTRIFHPIADFPGGIATPTDVMDVSTKNLGNGHFIEDRETVPALFHAIKYTTEVPDTIPVEFRVGIPTTSVEQTIDGIASPPVLGAGQVSAFDEQVTVFTHRTSASTRTPVLGSQLIGQQLVFEFGGSPCYVFRTLDSTGVLNLDTGFTVVSSFVRNLGGGLSVKESVLNLLGGWPVITSKQFNEEMQVFETETKQVVAAGTNPTSGTYFVEKTKALDQWKTELIRLTKTPTANSLGNALISYEYRPFQFPGTFDYSRWLHYSHGTGFRRASAQLCKHTIRTWWETNNSVPSVDDILADTVTLPIYTNSSTTEFQRFDSVLHDDFNTTQGEFYAATTPGYTDYYWGTPSGTTVVGIIVLSNPGTGYSVGDTVSLLGHNATVLSTGVSASILDLSFSGLLPNPVVTTSAGSVAGLTGGTGTGATGYILTITYQRFTPGTAWVGSEKVISASVKQTDIPGLWKKQTVSVVMR